MVPVGFDPSTFNPMFNHKGRGKYSCSYKTSYLLTLLTLLLLVMTIVFLEGQSTLTACPAHNKTFLTTIKLCVFQFKTNPRLITEILGNHKTARELWVKWWPPLVCLLSKLQPDQTFYGGVPIKGTPNYSPIYHKFCKRRINH